MAEKAPEKLNIDIASMMASSMLYKQYNDLTIAGFTPNEAVVYLATLMGYLTVNNKKVSKGVGK